jgi:hypothetical protein
VFAGLDTVAGTDIIRCETEGTTAHAIYLSARISPSFATGTYHVSIQVDKASYPLTVPPEPTTSVEGTITWDDASNAENVRPNSVALVLYKSTGGTPVPVVGATAVLDTTAGLDLWDYRFANLPQYEGGSAITYTVGANSVPGYSSAWSTVDLTLSHAAGQGILMVDPRASDFLNTGIDRSLIEKIEFLDTLPTGGTTFDVSAATPQDGSVIASWDTVTSTMTIGADGGVLANTDSSYLFALYSNLTALDLTNFYAEHVDDMSAMFARSNLPSGFTLPDGFGSKATVMYATFMQTGLPAGFTLPDGFGSVATSMRELFAQTVIPDSLTFPVSFGSEATNMNSMFSRTTLPTGLTEFPDGFGSKATNMAFMFSRTTLPAGLTAFPADFGSKINIMSSMFYYATLQNNLDWSRTTFDNVGLGTPPYYLDSPLDHMFEYCTFAGHTIMVADSLTLDWFTRTGTYAHPPDIVVAPTP